MVSLLQYLTDKMFAGKPRKSAPGAIFLGRSPHLYNRKESEEITLPPEALLRHAYLIGSTGSGKTYLILRLILELGRLRQGFGLIDIEGDLSGKVIEHFASRVTSAKALDDTASRIVLIEPFNRDFAPSFNPLSAKSVEDAYRQSFDMLGIFKRVWQDIAWGARMEEVLRNLLLTLSLSGSTLGEAQRFLIDEGFRQSITEQIPDRDLRLYWESRFGVLSEKMKSVYAEPVLNKITVFTSDPLVRHIISQKKSLIDFRRLMDRGAGVIINVSKGALSENAYLLGSLFVSKIKYAALSRSDQAEHERRPFYLFVDEFQNFMGQNFEEILSEARKYRLGLILAHQNLAQVPPRMRESIFGNVGTLLFFRLGHNDISEVAGEFPRSEQALLKSTLSTLKVGEAVRREPDGTFRKVSIAAINSVKSNPAAIKEIRQASITRFYGRRADLERERRVPEQTATLVKPVEAHKAQKPSMNIAAITSKPRQNPNSEEGTL